MTATLIHDLLSSPISQHIHSLQWINPLTHASKGDVNSVENDRLIKLIMTMN